MRTRDLVDEIRELEEAMLRGETRADRARMDALLHPDFVEVGRTGRIWSRAETLDEITSADAAPTIHADDVAVTALADGVALVTYRSAHVGADGARDRWSRRSSLWLRVEGTWRLRFHQGTPSDDF